MKVFADSDNIKVDATTQMRESARYFASIGMRDLYPESQADADADEYENKVLNIMKEQIGRTQTGRALFTAIAATKPRTMLISPQSRLDTTSSDPDLKYRLELNAFTAGVNFATGGPITCGPVVANAVILFSPEMFEPESAQDAGQSARETLLHEMVHGLRHMTGKDSCQMLNNEFFSVEEFIAMLVTNIFASEIGRPLRGGYKGMFVKQGPYGRNVTQRLPDALQDPKEFLKYKNCADLVSRFVSEHPTFAGALMDIRVPFNPIEEWFFGRRN
jgi:hypothetical protein